MSRLVSASSVAVITKRNGVLDANKSPLSIERQGDAGWGVGREPKFVVYKRYWHKTERGMVLMLEYQKRGESRVHVHKLSAP